MSFPAPAQAGVEDDSLLALLRPLLVLCPIIYLKFSHILNQAFNSSAGFNFLDRINRINLINQGN
jgi:hypothetical protein